MTRFVVCGLMAAWVLFVASPAAWADGVKSSGTQKVWRVAYHKESGHPQTGDHALRLRVDNTTSGNALSGRLRRYVYDETSNTYKKRLSADAGEIELTGLILSAGGGTGSRKTEKFILSGYFTDSDGKNHELIIRGYHAPGSTTDRDDDRICVRIRVRSFGPAGFAAAPVFAPGEPCDEQPPDEDILEEGPPGGDNDPYDGGS